MIGLSTIMQTINPQVKRGKNKALWYSLFLRVQVAMHLDSFLCCMLLTQRFASNIGLLKVSTQVQLAAAGETIWPGLTLKLSPGGAK